MTEHVAHPDIRLLASGLRFPEGPIALPSGDFLVVEIERGTLTRIRKNGVVDVVAELGGGPNGAAIGPDGECYVCNNGGFAWVEDDHGLRPVGLPDNYSGGRIERVNLATGAVQTLYTASDRAPLKGPNDLVFDNFGGFYFTDPGKSHGRTRDVGAVCYAKADGSFCREIIFPIVTPNGIGLSPDGGTLYVAETDTARLWAFELSGPGAIVPRPFPSQHGGWLIGAAEGFRRFDSLAVEDEGNICVASVMIGGVTVFSPSGGIVATVDLPDPYTTNLCFAGPDRKVAIVTLSSSGRLIALDWPRRGLAPFY